MQLIRALFQLKWYQLLFIFAVGTLIISSLLQFFTPKQAELQTIILENKDGSTSSFKTVTYTGELVDVPGTLRLGSATVAETPEVVGEKLRDRIITSFDLQPDNKHPGTFLNFEYTLTGLPDSQFTLVRTLEKPTGVISLIQATEVAEELVQQLYPENPPVLEKESVQYYTTASLSHPEETNPSTASQIELTFNYAFEGYPLFIDQAVIKPIVITINADAQIQKVVVTPALLQTSVGESLQTIPLSQALKNIQDERGSIIADTYEGHGNPLLTTIENAVFTAVSLEYRSDSNSKTVIPYYHFVGQLTNSDGQVFTGHVITPAVQTDFSEK